MTLRFLHSSADFYAAQTLIHRSQFLAKKSWSKPLDEMAIEGLSSHIWIGVGLFDENGRLISYLDYKYAAPDQIELGICCTAADHRRKGYMAMLLHKVISENQDITFRIGTYEGNSAMIHCILSTGFIEEFTIANDRIDGRSSIHFVYHGK